MSLFNDLLPHGPTTQSPRSSISASSEASSEFETESGRSDDDRPVLDAATLLLILQSPRIFPLDLNQASDFGSDTDDELSIIHDMPSDSGLNNSLESSIDNFQVNRFPSYEEICCGDYDSSGDSTSSSSSDQGDQDTQGDQLDDSDSESCMSPDVFTQPAESKDFTPFDLHDDYRPPGSEKSHTPAPIDTQNLTNPEPPYNSGGLAITYSSPAPSRASGALVHRFNSPSTRYHPYGQSKKLPY